MDELRPAKSVKLSHTDDVSSEARAAPTAATATNVADAPQIQMKELHWRHEQRYPKVASRIPISKPTEIACMTRNEKREWIPGSRKGLSTYHAPPTGSNLNVGFEDFITTYQPEKPEPIRNILQCIKGRYIPKGENQQCETKPDFVCWRGTLTKFMCFPYSRSDEFLFGVWKHNGVIYIHSRESESKKRQESNANATSNRFMYYGYKFEECCTRNPASVEFDRPVDTSVQFGSVFKVKVGQHRVVASAEVDCEDPHDRVPLPPGAPQNDRYRELKVTAIQNNPRSTRSFEKFKLLRWYCQSFIAGVPKLVAGFRDANGYLCSTQTFKVTRIPQLIAGREQDLWDANICHSFLDTILGWLKQNVQAEDVMLELHYSGNGHSITLKPDTDEHPDEMIPTGLYV